MEEVRPDTILMARDQVMAGMGTALTGMVLLAIAAFGLIGVEGRRIRDNGTASTIAGDTVKSARQNSGASD